MKAIIAGGGVGGMVGALLLRKQGVDVTLFERETVLGGRLQYAEGNGYRIDKGPTIVLLPHMIRSVLTEAGIPESTYRLKRLDPLYDIHFQSGKTYRKHADKEKQKREIERVFPGESAGFDRFMTEMGTHFQNGYNAFLTKPFFTKASFFNVRTIQSLLEMRAYRSVYSGLKRYFSSEELIQAYALQSLYIGGNPYSAPSIYSLVSFSEHEHGIYYVEGGYASLVELLHRHLEEAGVHIHLGAPVDRVVMKDGRAVGIQSNGTLYEADAVVLNGDFPGAEKLLGTSRKKRRYQSSSGCFLLYIGADKQFLDKQVHQFYLSDDFKQNMDAVFTRKQWPADPSFYVFNPSLIDSSLAPDGKSSLYVLVPVPSGDAVAWETHKQSFAEAVIEKMEQKGFRGLKESIEWLEIRTPAEARAEGLFAGGSFGIAPELSQSGVFRPQVKVAGTENVYATGASVHPGGGIPIVMQSAQMMAEAVQSDWKIEQEKRRKNDEHRTSIQPL